jgi:hypothetical protein
MRRWVSTVGPLALLTVLPLAAVDVRGGFGWRPHAGAADVAVLRNQVGALESGTNDLQKRIAAIERARSRYGDQPTVGQGIGKSNIVRAPFEVQDAKGVPIFRVVERGVASRGLYVFNESGNVAAQVAVLADGGGRIYVFPGKEPFGGITTPAFAAIAYPKTGPMLEMTRPDGNMQNRVSAMGFEAFNKNGVGVAKLGTMPGSGAGVLMLGEPKGNAIVEAGMLQDGRGVVRAYPLGGKPPIPIPQFLMGTKIK